TGCLHKEHTAQHLPVVEAISRAQPASQKRSLPVGDVDAYLLHQSGGKEPAEAAARAVGGGQERAARALRQEVRPALISGAIPSRKLAQQVPIRGLGRWHGTLARQGVRSSRRMRWGPSRTTRRRAGC